MNPKIIYFRESFIQSLASDLTTFAFLCGSVWFNQTYCGGSYFLNGILLVMFIMFIGAKLNVKAARFTSIDDAIAHLQKTKESQ